MIKKILKIQNCKIKTNIILMISTLLNIFHLLFLFIPFIVYFLPFKLVNKYYKYVILIIILTPLHWKLFDNKCILTIASNQVGDDIDNSKDNPFTEKYLRWLYEPIMTLFGWKWNNKNIAKMVNVHWIIIFILIWYYIFFFNNKVCYI